MSTLYQLLRSKGYTRVRLQSLSTNHYVLVATLNGVKGRFILDSGASNTCVSTELTAHFHLNAKPSEEKPRAQVLMNCIPRWHIIIA